MTDAPTKPLGQKAYGSIGPGDHAVPEPGDLVDTETCSGEVITCTVLRQCDNTFPPDSFELASPMHGYVIVRHRSELNTPD